MACIAPPPPVIEVTVLVTASAPNSATFSATHPASTPYVQPDGELDFSCFKTPIRVTFRLADASEDQGIVFDAGYNGKGTPLTFLDDNGNPNHKPQVPPGHHQFPSGPPAGGTTSFSFVYQNHWDCGDGSHKPNCLKSKYGLRFSNSMGHLGEVDPIVDNGGNPN